MRWWIDCARTGLRCVVIRPCMMLFAMDWVRTGLKARPSYLGWPVCCRRRYDGARQKDSFIRFVNQHAGTNLTVAGAITATSRTADFRTASNRRRASTAATVSWQRIAVHTALRCSCGTDRNASGNAMQCNAMRCNAADPETPDGTKRLFKDSKVHSSYTFACTLCGTLQRALI
jgi:hypothetical protein